MQKKGLKQTETVNLKTGSKFKIQDFHYKLKLNKLNLFKSLNTYFTHTKIRY